jgi:hypothetical protein
MSEIKFSCPQCGQKILCDGSASGTFVNCPACNAPFMVPDPREAQVAQPKDVFIIYRKGSQAGGELARLVSDGLIRRSFEVYPPGENLEKNHPDPADLKRIGLARDVVVIFTTGCFDRCENENDPLRREVVQALRTRKNIVSIVDRQYVAPSAALPADMAELLLFPQRTLVAHLWEESMDKMVADLLKSKSRALVQQNLLALSRARPLAMFAVVVAVLGVLVGLACLPQLNYLLRQKQLANLALITKVTLGFVFGLNSIILVGAGLAYALKKSGVKVINSTASALMLSNTACSVAYIVAARGNGLTNISVFGAPVLIWLVTSVPLVFIGRRTSKFLN